MRDDALTGQIGSVIWLTGLSDSGKTTVGHLVADKLRASGASIVRLDGDELRKIFGKAGDHSRDTRIRLGYQYCGLCEVLARQGYIVVISAIAMFSEVQAWSRARLPGFFQVYLKIPLAEVRRRDTKGIYSAFDRGVEKNVCGLDLNVDEPEQPDFLEDFKPERRPDAIAKDIVDEWYRAIGVQLSCAR